MAKEKWVDLSELPHNKSRISWKRSAGCKIPFKYDDIEDYITIVKWVSTEKIIIDYKGKQYPTCKSGIIDAKFGIFLDKVHYDWKYELNDKVINEEKYISAKIISRYKKKTSMSLHSRFYKLLCDYCGQDYDRLENDVDNRGCPICNNSKIIKGVNDLWATHPHIAQQLKNPEDGYNVTYGQRKYFDWICPFCGEEIKHKTPMYVINAKNECVSCEKCSDAYSFPNKFVFNLLREIGIDFVAEKTFDWVGLRLRRYDFYIPEYNMIIEVHGDQHYDSRFPHIHKNDIEKKQIALNNHIDKYIEIDAKRSNGDYIFQNVVKALSDYYDFSNVNVDKISMQAFKKIADIAFELLEQYDYDITKVANYLQIHRETVSRYLNTAIKAKLVSNEIVRKKQLQNKIKQHYQLDGNPVRIIETGQVFGNYTQIQEYFALQNKKFSSGSMKQSIWRNGTAYGYHWEFISREEFNRIKEMNPDLAYGDFFENVGC